MKNRETEEPKEKILRQEEFSVDCPRRIVVGDPSYFEEFSGERLKRLTANYAPPRFFEASVVVKQNCYTWDRIIPACALLRMVSTLHCMNVV